MFNFLKKEHIKNSHKLLSWSLLGGAIYFFLITLAHIFGFKIPILFIYYNVPSYIYQDLIIAFLSFGFGMFLYAGYSGVKQNQILITKYIIIAGVGAILGLININAFTDFSFFENEFSLSIKVSHFWGETIGVLIYVFWIALLYLSAINSDKNKSAKVPISTSKVSYNSQKEFMKFR
ncbi:MAG: hypothetical protein L3J41_12610 [Melioribacteraceae bacterium]|nr:hypothetical protein [Melioribacteraceae bacterium]